MKNKLRFFAVLCAVVLCMTAFSVTAFAGGGDELPPEYEISDHTHTDETGCTNTQTVTFDVVVHEDGSKTITVGDNVFAMRFFYFSSTPTIDKEPFFWSQWGDSNT